MISRDTEKYWTPVKLNWGKDRSDLTKAYLIKAKMMMSRGKNTTADNITQRIFLLLVLCGNVSYAITKIMESLWNMN